MALVTVFGEDGLDVPGEINLRRTDRASDQKTHDDPALQQSDGGHGDQDVECGVLFKSGDGNLWSNRIESGTPLQKKTGAMAKAITPVLRISCLLLDSNHWAKALCFGLPPDWR